MPYVNQPTLPQMTEEERLAYYQEACKRGLESRLIPPFFTCIGKMKVLALLMLIVMMMLAIVTTLVSAAFLTLISLSAGFYFMCTYFVCFFDYIIDALI